MPLVLVSGDVILPRAIQLLQDTSIDLMRVTPSAPRVVMSSELGLGDGRLFMWEVDRPAFVIDKLPF